MLVHTHIFRWRTHGCCRTFPKPNQHHHHNHKCAHKLKNKQVLKLGLNYSKRVVSHKEERRNHHANSYTNNIGNCEESYRQRTLSRIKFTEDGPNHRMATFVKEFITIGWDIAQKICPPIMK